MLYFCTLHVWSNPLDFYMTFSWLGNSIWVGILLWMCLSGSISETESNSCQGLLELIISLMASHAEWLPSQNQWMLTITTENCWSVCKTTCAMGKAECGRWQFPTSSWRTGVELIQYKPGSRLKKPCTAASSATGLWWKNHYWLSFISTSQQSMNLLWGISWWLIKFLK